MKTRQYICKFLVNYIRTQSLKYTRINKRKKPAKLKRAEVKNVKIYEYLHFSLSKKQNSFLQLLFYRLQSFLFHFFFHSHLSFVHSLRKYEVIVSIFSRNEYMLYLLFIKQTYIIQKKKMYCDCIKIEYTLITYLNTEISGNIITCFAGLKFNKLIFT